MPAQEELHEELIPGSTGYICVICEQALITAVETSCRHKFCSYCISLWKKHHPLCPICTCEIRSLFQRPDLDDLIERFFDTANEVMQRDRKVTVDKRRKVAELNKGNPEGNIDEMKALIDHLKPPSTAIDSLSSQSMTRPSTAAPDKNKDIIRVVRDTQKFEQQLNMVYSKILTTGERLTSREDQIVSRLCGSVIDNDSACKENTTLKTERPHTVMGPVSKASSFKSSRARLGTAIATASEHAPLHQEKSPKEESDIDSLIELTDDVLRIDHFLKTFNFETLTDGGNLEGFGDDKDIHDANDPLLLPILNDDSIQATTNQLLGNFQVDAIFTNPNFKIHPEVQKHLDKIAFTVKPRIPLVKKTTPNTNQTARPKTSINENTKGLSANYQLNAEFHGPSNSSSRTRVPGNTKGSGPDLTAKILQCRESLVNLKEKSEQAPNPKMTFKPFNYSGRQVEQEQDLLEPDDDDSVGEMKSLVFENRPHGDGRQEGRTLGHSYARLLTNQLPESDQSTLLTIPQNRVSTSILPVIAPREAGKKPAGMRIRPQTAVDSKNLVNKSKHLPRPR